MQCVEVDLDNVRSGGEGEGEELRSSTADTVPGQGDSSAPGHLETTNKLLYAVI